MRAGPCSPAIPSLLSLLPVPALHMSLTTKFLNQIRWFCPCVVLSGALMQRGEPSCPGSGAGSSSLCSCRRGAKMAGGEAPGYTPAGSGVRLQRGSPLPADCPLHSPVGLWPCSFLPSSLRLETSAPPPQALTKAPRTRSPSDFPSRVFEELGSTGGREGGMGAINHVLPAEGRPRDLFDGQKGSAIPWGACLSAGTWWLNASLGGSSEINHCHGVKVTGYFLPCVR